MLILHSPTTHEGGARRSSDPDAPEVVFDASSHLHLAMGMRGWRLDHMDVILGAIEVPDLCGDVLYLSVTVDVVHAMPLGPSEHHRP